MTSTTKEKTRYPFLFGMLVVIGLFIRFWLSTTSYNVDVVNYLLDVRIFHNGGNIYLLQPAYNYTPLWFWMLGILDTVRLLCAPFLSFPVWIRAVLGLVDLGVLALLVVVAREQKKSEYVPLLLFFLNPIAIVISSKHGQFDTAALGLLVLSWIAAKRGNAMGAWLFGTMALLLKHIVLFPLLVLYMNVYGGKKGIGAMAGSFVIFCASFLPYISGLQPIIKHVLLYGGAPGLYGVSWILTSVYRSLFHISAVSLQSSVAGVPQGVSLIYYGLTATTILSSLGFVVWIYKKTDAWRAMLATTLWFLGIATGIGSQYFILPVVFASVYPTWEFGLYTLGTTLFFLGYSAEFGIDAFRFISWNVVWLVVLYWLLKLIPALVKRNTINHS